MVPKFGFFCAHGKTSFQDAWFGNLQQVWKQVAPRLALCSQKANSHEGTESKPLAYEAGSPYVLHV